MAIGSIKRKEREASYGFYTVQFETDGTTQTVSPDQIETQIPIAGLSHPKYADATHTGELIPLLLNDSRPVLIVAGPGTGKTWSMKQLAFLMADALLSSPPDEAALVPLLLPVQDLARMLRSTNERETPRSRSQIVRNLIVDYIESSVDERWKSLLADAASWTIM